MWKALKMTQSIHSVYNKNQEHKMGLLQKAYLPRGSLIEFGSSTNSKKSFPSLLEQACLTWTKTRTWTNYNWITSKYNIYYCTDTHSALAEVLFIENSVPRVSIFSKKESPKIISQKGFVQKRKFVYSFYWLLKHPSRKCNLCDFGTY